MAYPARTRQRAGQTIGPGRPARLATPSTRDASSTDATAPESVPQPPRPPLLHTLAQACQELHVSDPTLRELVRSGQIRPVRIGRAVRIAHAELERFVSEATGAAHRDR